MVCAQPVWAGTIASTTELTEGIIWKKVSATGSAATDTANIVTAITTSPGVHELYISSASSMLNSYSFVFKASVPFGSGLVFDQVSIVTTPDSSQVGPNISGRVVNLQISDTEAFTSVYTDTTGLSTPTLDVSSFALGAIWYKVTVTGASTFASLSDITLKATTTQGPPPPAVPEPGTWALLASGVVALAIQRVRAGRS
ncbi:MAG: PEP-CTERM sorting domain-containing protein [Planctomycetaceae bacterium]